MINLGSLRSAMIEKRAVDNKNKYTSQKVTISTTYLTGDKPQHTIFKTIYLLQTRDLFNKHKLTIYEQGLKNLKELNYSAELDFRNTKYENFSEIVRYAFYYLDKPQYVREQNND